MLLEVIADVCTACAPSSPPLVPTLAGDVGSPTTSPPPSNRDRSERPYNDSPGPSDSAPPNDDPPTDEKPSWWDRIFDSREPDVDDGSHDVAKDVTKAIGQDVAFEIGLHYGSKAVPAAAAVVGVGGQFASGAQSAAELTAIVVENDGRGMGGSSKNGREIWDALDQELGIKRRFD